MKHANEHLQFKYGSASLKNFRTDEKYRIAAIPFHLIKGTIATIYRLALTIIPGTTRLVFGKASYLKAQLFFALRNMQEMYGRIALIFSRTHGAYHIQESQFHKECYAHFLDGGSHTSGFSFSHSAHFSHGVWVDSTAKDVSLYDYKKKSDFERKALLEKYKIKASIPTNDLVERLDDKLLKKITFEDLILPVKNSKLKFALMTDEAFEKMTLTEIKDDIEMAQLKFIKQRLKTLPKSSSLALQEIPANFNDLTLKELLNVSGVEIANHIDSVVPLTFCLLSNDQIIGLELSKMSATQIEALFYTSKKKTEEKLKYFSNDDIVDALKKELLNVRVLECLKPEHFRTVKLSSLPAKTVNQLFSSSNSVEDKKEIFKSFSADDVIEYLEKNANISSSLIDLLDEKHFSEIKLSMLTKETISKLFSYKSDNTLDRKKFAHFHSKEVNHVLIHGLLTGFYMLSLLSDKQLKKLPLSKLPKDTINTLFSYKSDSTEDRRKFALIDPKEVSKAVAADLISGSYLIGLLSEKQVQSIDFSKVSQNCVNTLFPTYSVEELRKQFSHYESRFETVNGKVTKNFNGMKCSFSEEELQKKSQQIKQKNDELYNKLSPKQKSHLDPRLYQKEAPKQEKPKQNPFKNFFNKTENNPFSSTFNAQPKDPFSGFGNFGGTSFNQTRQNPFHNFFNEDPFKNFFNDSFFNTFNGFNNAGQDSQPLSTDQRKKHLETLGLEEGATEDQIKKQYKKLALKLHPDKNPRKDKETDEEYDQRVTNKFKELNEAFSSLAKN